MPREKNPIKEAAVDPQPQSRNDIPPETDVAPAGSEGTASVHGSETQPETEKNNPNDTQPNNPLLVAVVRPNTRETKNTEVTLLRQKKHYELITMLTTIALSGASVWLYVETLKKARIDQQISGIGVNFFENIFFIKVTLDKLAERIEKNQSGRVFAISLLAILLYGPQVLTSILESPYSPPVTALSAALIGASGVGLYGFAVENLFAFIEKYSSNNKKSSVAAFNAERPIILKNVVAIQERLRFVDYHTQKLILPTTDEQLITQCIEIELARTAPTPLIKKFGPVASFVGNATKMLFQFSAAAVLVYGAYAYQCSTDVSAQNDFKLSPLWAMILGHILMSPQYVLSIKGGLGLIDNIADTFVPAINYKKLPNDFKLGGTIGFIVSVAAPLLAVLIGSESGKTSKDLYNQNCNVDNYNNKLMFPFADIVIDYSARAFNIIFCAMAFCFMIKYAVEHAFGNNETVQQDREFLKWLAALTNFQEKVQANEADDKAIQLINKENIFNFATDDHSEAPVSPTEEKPPSGTLHSFFGLFEREKTRNIATISPPPSNNNNEKTSTQNFGKTRF